MKKHIRFIEKQRIKIPGTNIKGGIFLPQSKAEIRMNILPITINLNENTKWWKKHIDKNAIS